MFTKNDYFNYFEQIKNLEFVMLKYIKEFNDLIKNENINNNELYLILDQIRKEEGNHIKQLDYILEAVLNDKYIPTANMSKEKFYSIMNSFNQQHIIDHFSPLSSEKQNEFLSNISNLDFNLVFLLYKNYISNIQKENVKSNIKPVNINIIPHSKKESNKGGFLRYIGDEWIKNSKTAVLIAAGGQGTRLGHPGPKGTFKISPIRNKTLFQIYSEIIIALEKKYNIKIPLIFLTNEENRIDTESFFKFNNYFGLDKN
ncbi:UTP--glucose-1-phosphate uridylyltransferase, partial [Candidatus Desantisbacteria bacterium]|nr:UTP--glucose-1-phosphate uridylyltransferase [Candidatus Desantisbacteria bacterium]